VPTVEKESESEDLEKFRVIRETLWRCFYLLP